MIKNFKKLYATILALAFSSSCIVNVATFASEFTPLSRSCSAIGPRIGKYTYDYSDLSSSAPAALGSLGELYVEVEEQLREKGENLPDLQLDGDLSSSMSGRLYDTCERAVDPIRMTYFRGEDDTDNIVKKRQLAVILSYLYDITLDTRFVDVDKTDPAKLAKVKSVVVETTKKLWGIDLETSQTNPLLSNVDGGKISYFDALLRLSGNIWRIRTQGAIADTSHMSAILSFLKDNDVLKIFTPILNDSFKDLSFYRYYTGFMKQKFGTDLETYMNLPDEVPYHSQTSSENPLTSSFFDYANATGVSPWDIPEER